LAQPVDDFVRDIGFAIDGLGVEMLVAEAFEVLPPPVQLRRVATQEAADKEHPIGDETAFEQSLGHAGFLGHRPQQFLGLLHCASRWARRSGG
jgi:hypothetical protein